MFNCRIKIKTDDLKLLLADAGQIISVLPDCPER